MTRIAICDDDLSFAGVLESALQEIQTQSAYTFSIDVFVSGKELIRAMSEASFDILFLDIEMSELTGIDVGNYIRKTIEDYQTVIIYVSSYEQYHHQLYPTMPIAFVQKPLDQELLLQSLNHALSVIKRLKPNFTYHKGHRILKIKKKAIYYFESDGKKIRLVTETGEDSFTMTMDKLAESLENDTDFMMVHRAFIANLENVSTFSRTELFFPNHDSIPISTKRGKEVRKALLRYLKENDIHPTQKD